MIDIRKLKELVRLMVANDLTELDLRDSEEQVTLRRPSQKENATVTLPTFVSPPAVATSPAPAAAPDQPASTPSPAETREDGLHPIESPMVGTFYSKPNPDAEPFVTAGNRVDPDTVVCLVEAMKIFNEIKAECSGTVRKVLIDSGEPVEFGQPLFLVKAD